MGSVTDERAVERLLFFTDAVVAIAITLLALELPVPEGRTAHALWSSVHHDEGHYVAFLISFVVIGMSWKQHHRALGYLARCDSRLSSLNLLWLLTIVLIPFATRLLVGTRDLTTTVHALRFSFYAVVEVVANLTMIAMIRHANSRKLFLPETPPSLPREVERNAFGTTASFALSIPVLFATTAGWVLWIVGPIVAGRLVRGTGRDSA